MKTAFKRVALVAAAALAIGGVSAVSAQAGTAPTLAGSASSSTATLVTGTYTAETIVTGSADKYYTITSTGVGVVNYPSSVSGNSLSASATGEIFSAGTGAIGTANFNGTDSLVVSVYSTTAGSQVVTLKGDSSAAITLTITWGAAPVVSAANSLVVANNAASLGGTLKITTATADTSIIATPTYGVVAGGAFVKLLDNSASPGNVTADKITATVSGPGFVKITGQAFHTDAATTATELQADTFTSFGKSVTTAAAGQYALVELAGDSTTGVATVTVSDSTAGVTLGTFTVTFYGTAAKFVATNTAKIYAPTTAPAFPATQTITVVATDASGNIVPGATIYATSATTTVAAITASAVTDPTGTATFTVTGAAAGTSVITFANAPSSPTLTITDTITVGNSSISKVVFAFDAASYAAGAPVSFTITATDSSGNPVADGTYAAVFTAVPVESAQFGGAALTTTPKFSNGVATYALYAPLADATVSISATTVSGAPVATAGQAVVVTGTTAVVSASSDAANAATDAANEALDAANAATDAAIAAGESADAATTAATDAGDKADAALAAVTALSQQVTTVLAKVAALASTLAKITAAIAKLPKK